MLQRMLLINSANFQFADIDLSKEVFFVGENASGKTTSTRALHFLYNGDGQKLGIPAGKDSFARHYFPDDESYIIYIFDTFFIFTYKRNDTIRRWFSKQIFDLGEVIRNEKLLDFKTIERYIKSAPLHYRPQTIEEYTSIIYGKDKRYLDFSIARIDNYTVFLDVFNMIFNIDKAIVTASDIKKAIQKSLERSDEMLSIDYEEFIRKLNGFSKAYHFFKTFDINRGNLNNAIECRGELLDLEAKKALTHKAINYRHRLELEEYSKLSKLIERIGEEISAIRSKGLNINKLHEGFSDRISKKINALIREIAKIEDLKEKFNPLDLEENVLLAAKHDGIKIELDGKKLSLGNLKSQQTSAQKEIDNEIQSIEHRIAVVIPNEAKQNAYKRSEIHRQEHESEKLEIEKEFSELRDGVSEQVREHEGKIDAFKKEKSAIDSLEIERKQDVNKQYERAIKPIEAEKDGAENERGLVSRKIRMLQDGLLDLKSELQLHEAKYKKLRSSNAGALASVRKKQNNKIANMMAILNPEEGTLTAFFSREIDGWEKDVYPVIDKDLLKRRCDELRPEVLDANAPIGFRLNASVLDTIPTKEEAYEAIRDARRIKSETLRNSKDVYRSEVAKLDEKKHELLAALEANECEINNLIDKKAALGVDAEKAGERIDALKEELKVKLAEIGASSVKNREALNEKILAHENEIKRAGGELRGLNKSQAAATTKSAQSRDYNINIVQTDEKKKAVQRIAEAKKTIDELQLKKSSLGENELIADLEQVVRELEDEYNASLLAKDYLVKYEDAKDAIAQLPAREMKHGALKKHLDSRNRLVKMIQSVIDSRITGLRDKKLALEEKRQDYDKGVEKIKKLGIDTSGEAIESELLLKDLVDHYEEIERNYKNRKASLRDLISKLKSLEVHALIEINLDMKDFDEVETIADLKGIAEGLQELENFEKNKYDGEKKRSHNNFDSFLRNTIPSKLQSFDDLESDFEKAKAAINKGLAGADFGVIKDIKLVTDHSKKRTDSISGLLQDLAKKVQDTVGLYSSKSLFYHDISKSVGNIGDIQEILEDIKKKGSSGPINLFDTIDLSISYIENGKKVDNKQNIKDDSSSGGNILLKVAIAMSILNRYAKKTQTDTPFFLIIDEVSKLQIKNQDIIRHYINENGFRTLFITPDPAYPDPDRALYYTFKNIQEEGETLEIMQMNIV